MASDIFIQIASYRDPELLPTMGDALEKAACPESVHFGVCFQESANHPDYEALKTFPQCRVVQVEPEESGGTCQARAIAQSLWQNEAYTLQIDSHARFVPGWDTLAIEMLTRCGEKAILTAYCPPYEPGQPLEPNPGSWTLGADYFSPHGILLLRARLSLRDADSPVPGAFWSGHCSFSKGELIGDVPYDPNLYFHGEEISFAVRAWTHGYNIFYPHRAICYHQYGRTARVAHWSEHKDVFSTDVLSKQRVRRLLNMESKTETLGRYDLGTERTLADYEAFSGVNFIQKRCDEKALNGWYSD